MYLGVVGCRTVKDYNLVVDAIDKIDGVTGIVSGGAHGVDAFAARYAKEHELELIEHLPEWDRYGKRAGYLRNKLIVRDSDKVLAIWDGQSKGTKLSIDIARDTNTPLIIVSI